MLKLDNLIVCHSLREFTRTDECGLTSNVAKEEARLQTVNTTVCDLELF